MPIVEITATLDGEGAQDAAAHTIAFRRVTPDTQERRWGGGVSKTLRSIDLSLALAGDSAWTLGAGVSWGADAQLGADSTVSAIAGSRVEATAAMTAGSDFIQRDSTVNYFVAAALLGESIFSASEVLAVPVTASIAGISAFTAVADLDLANLEAILALICDSVLSVDPAQITIVNFRRGSQVPVPVPPIPKIRITAPIPWQPSNQITTPSNRNRPR